MTGLAPGEQRIIPNAIDYLESGGTRRGVIITTLGAIDPLKSRDNRGAPILATEDRIGTLRVEFEEFSSSDVAITVRTTTPAPEGRAGLAYPAIPAEAGFGDEAVYVCGLRQSEQDRSNLAFQNMGESGDGAITLRTTVFSGDVDGGGPRVLRDVTLAPGGFHQYSGLLETAGFTQGYAKVERVRGTAPFHAYGVINDQANSDGSFVSAVRERSLAGVTGQTLPVIVETNVFSSELMVTNFSEVPKTVRFRFRAEAVETPDRTATVEWTFRPGQQVMVPNLVDMMRKMGTPGIGPSGQTFAGALFATVAEGDMGGIAIGARTTSPRRRRAVRRLLQRGTLRGGVRRQRLGVRVAAEPGKPVEPGAGQYRRSRREPQCFSTGHLRRVDGDVSQHRDRPEGCRLEGGIKSTASWPTTLRKPGKAMCGSQRFPATIPSWPTE